jgi:hypothetical protein
MFHLCGWIRSDALACGWSELISLRQRQSDLVQLSQRIAGDNDIREAVVVFRLDTHPYAGPRAAATARLDFGLDLALSGSHGGSRTALV